MRRISRRWFLAAATSSPAFPRNLRGTRLDTPREGFRDGLTEREVFRLTDPSVLHHLPGHNHRFIARNNSFLLLLAEHGGVRHVHRLELKRRRLTQVTDGAAVHPYAVCLRGNDRGFYYLQGNELIQADLGGAGRRVHYRCPQGWTLTGEMDISRAGRYAALVEMREEDWHPDPARLFASDPRCRVRVVEIRRGPPGRGSSRVAAEEGRWLSAPRFRPWRSQLLYMREGPWRRVRRRFHLVGLDGTGKAGLRPARGRERLTRAYWQADGSRLRYVRFPDGDRWKASICSVVPETGQEAEEASCSAFSWFRENADGTAIAGASRRPSGPNVYVLFPRMRREITLCEHLSSLAGYPVAGTDRLDPLAAVPDPVFSGDSAWLYFVSDRDGMPALYGMPVDDLVGSTPQG